MKSGRMSRLQTIILSELEKRPSKTANVSDLSFRVAKRYAPNKIWRLEDCKHNDILYVVARSCHRQTKCIRNVFSASFSRSLRNLENKALVQLVRGKFDIVWDGSVGTVYRTITMQRRVTFVVHHESKYFGNENADAEFIFDLVREIRRDVNNKQCGVKE